MTTPRFRLLSRIAFALLLVGGALVAASTLASAGRDAGPPTPPWVRADGTVDTARIPRSVPKLGPDGRPVRDATGTPVTVRLDPRPPQDRPAQPDPGIAPGTSGVPEIVDISEQPPAG